MQAGELEVGQDLCGVDRFDAFHDLEFDDDPAFDEDVDPVAAVDGRIAIRHAHRFFPFDAEPPIDQLVDEACLISGFEQTGAELAVDGDRRANGLFRDLVDVHARVLRIASGPLPQEASLEAVDLNMAWPDARMGR